MCDVMPINVMGLQSKVSCGFLKFVLDFVCDVMPINVKGVTVYSKATVRFAKLVCLGCVCDVITISAAVSSARFTGPETGHVTLERRA